MSPADQHLAAQTALYGPCAAHLRQQLPDIAEGVRAALQTLHDDPHPSACEMAAIRLDGIRRHVQALGDALRREASV